MRRFFDNKKVWLTAAAVVLAGGISINSAMAYFTANTVASGGQTIELKKQEADVEEDVSNMTKHISIRNTGEADVYVRVKLFYGSQFKVQYSGDASWTPATDGYYEYADIVAPGDSTKVLDAKIIIPEQFRDAFNVAVVQECTPVFYNEDGTPKPADWTLKSEIVEGSGR